MQLTGMEKSKLMSAVVIIDAVSSTGKRNYLGCNSYRAKKSKVDLTTCELCQGEISRHEKDTAACSQRRISGPR